MRIALVQFQPEFPGRDRNWERIRALADSTDADIVVFPELSSCGYMYETPGEIEPYVDTRDALAPLEEIARRRNRLLVGGFAERSGEALFNSAYVVGPDRTDVFRKIHLWNYETQIFRPGDATLVREFRGRRIGVEICYDLQFPELAALYARQGAELLLIPMAWPEEPLGLVGGLQSYTYLAVATALAHGIFVGVANRIGREKDAEFPGESSLADPFGRLVRLGREEGVLTGTPDFDLVPAAKRPNPRNDLDRDARLPISLPSPIGGGRGPA